MLKRLDERCSAKVSAETANTFDLRTARKILAAGVRVQVYAVGCDQAEGGGWAEWREVLIDDQGLVEHAPYRVLEHHGRRGEHR